MPYPQPTLTALQQQGMQDLAASPVGFAGFLLRSVLRALMTTLAGFAWLHYDYQAYIARQSVPWSATDEYALGWGALKNVAPKPATPASLIVALPAGSATANASVPNQTGFTRGDGAAYLTTAAATVAADGSCVVTLQAVTPGSAGDCLAGTPLQISGSVTGVPASGWTVTSQSTPGTDPETGDAFKARYLAAYAAPAQGGSVADWIGWALAVAGVTRAWVVPWGQGPGTVVIFFMMDGAEALYLGFPQGSNGVAAAEYREPTLVATGDQLAVASALYAPNRPVTALTYLCAPIQTPVPFTITGLGVNNTVANQAAITAALADMFLQLGQVGGAIDPTTGAPFLPIETSSWYSAIAGAIGNSNFNVSSPAAPLQPGPGQLFTLGPISFA